MNHHEYNSIREIIEQCNKSKGENTLFAETHCEGKVIINDPSFYKGDKTKPNQQDLNSDDQIRSQIWSYLI